MASLNKCILIALIGSVMLTAVLAASNPQIPDVAGDAGAALKGAQNMAQGAAQAGQNGAQNATNGIIGFGSKLYDRVKSTGNSILSRIPFMGDNTTDNAAQEEEEEVAAAASTEATESAGVEEPQEEGESAQEEEEEEGQSESNKGPRRAPAAEQ